MTPDVYSPFYSHSWAFVVGINQYRSVGGLSYAVNDATAVREVLSSRLDFEEQRIFFLADVDATRANITRTFSGLRGLAHEPDDRLLFFFAGHGLTHQGTRGPVGFLIPHDGDPSDLGSLIYFDDLVRTSELIPAKHVLFIMDACYGGVLLRRTVPPGSQRFLRSMLQRYARQVITAGKEDEPVDDGGGPGGQNSIFTAHLVAGLSGQASNSQQILSANGLMQYVYDCVGTDPKSDQTPHFGYLDGDGDFILDAPNKEHLRLDSGRDFMVAVPPQIAQAEPPRPLHRPSFLGEGGYLDPAQPSFGRNIWTDKLGEVRRAPQSMDTVQTAYSWLSLIAEPTALGALEINIAEELNRLPYAKPADTPHHTKFPVPPLKQTTIDTAIRFDPFQDTTGLWKAYLRVDRTGNIEYAECHNVFMEFSGHRLFRYVTLIGLSWQFQFLVKEILHQNGYDSGVKFTINMVGTRDTILADFAKGKGKGNQKWLEPFEEGFFGTEPSLLQLKCPNINIQLLYDFYINELDEDVSKRLVIDVAERLGLAYNHQSPPRCFNFDTYDFPWAQYFRSRSYR